MHLVGQSANLAIADIITSRNIKYNTPFRVAEIDLTIKIDSVHFVVTLAGIRRVVSLNGE
jgi:hypothetical protein